jgi:hypothetical protein
MDIKDHGSWRRYKPHKLPEGAPPNTMFAERIPDNVDWYDYVNSGENFAEDSVVMTVVDGVVAAATMDPTALFPAGATVLEIPQMVLHDPQEAFGDKSYDAAKREFYARSLPDPGPSVADLLKRIEALESKGA